MSLNTLPEDTPANENIPKIIDEFINTIDTDDIEIHYEPGYWGVIINGYGVRITDRIPDEALKHQLPIIFDELKHRRVIND